MALLTWWPFGPAATTLVPFICDSFKTNRILDSAKIRASGFFILLLLLAPSQSERHSEVAGGVFGRALLVLCPKIKVRTT